MSEAALTPTAEKPMGAVEVPAPEDLQRLPEGKKPDFRAWVEGVVRSAIRLQVVTIVGDPDLKGSVGDVQASVRPDDPGEAIVTSINVLEGDITTVIAPKNSSEDRKWLRDYHAAQVDRAQELVAKNLDAVASLGKKLADVIGKHL